MTRHLGADVRAYVERTMSPPHLAALDRHLVACGVCRYAAEQERRLVASLRHGSTPLASADLQLMLMSLASGPSPLRADPTHTDGGGAPAVPVAPLAARQRRLATVAASAPPLHRSPRRAAAFAGLAAGASAAAVFGLSVGAPATANGGSGPAPASARVSVAGAVPATVLRVDRPAPLDVTSARTPVTSVGFASPSGR